MKQLIVNADDFGYTRGVNRAIVEACRGGIVTATSLMANAAAFEDAVELARQTPQLDVGCHLNLVEDRPLSAPSAIPHLVDAEGKFFPAKTLGWKLLTGGVPAAELDQELAAQVERVIAAGFAPSHLDTHQHAHLHPAVAAAVARTAKRYGIGWVRRPFENFAPPAPHGFGARRMLAAGLLLLAPPFDRIVAAHGLRCSDSFSGFILTGALTREALRVTIEQMREGVTEIMCHPGYADAELAGAPTRLQRQRQDEFEALTDPALRDVLRARGIQLAGYRDLPETVGIVREAPQPAIPGRPAMPGEARRATPMSNTGELTRELK